MIKIGITGGIGSGKSVVAHFFTLSGIPVYIADEESKYLTDHSPVIRKKLSALFGNEIYTNSGLDRKRFASFIFSNQALLKKVNEIIHPVVKKDFIKWVNAQKGGICALESAILYESGFDKSVDTVLMVYAPVELRLARVMQRDGSDEADIMRRMNRQRSDDLKRKQADYVIINDDANALTPQLEKFLNSLPKQALLPFPVLLPKSQK